MVLLLHIEVYGHGDYSALTASVDGAEPVPVGKVGFASAEDLDALLSEVRGMLMAEVEA